MGAEYMIETWIEGIIAHLIDQEPDAFFQRFSCRANPGVILDGQ